ncbi:MAG TPA: beta-propeller fold lactonase family protein [Candidatus Sulfotelmatobacter sp.]|nr:beta-propeller fold lactonase family protein [Candidatus Sulfotelmatobacter sp.]
MSKRLWLLGLGSLVLIGFLVACGSSFNNSTDGLLLVGSQGGGLIETFSFSLNTGQTASVANPVVDTADSSCVLNALPAGMVANPAGTYAFVILNHTDQCPNSPATGIATFQIKTDGTLSQVGSPITDPNPISLSMDPAGKFLFVAEGSDSLPTSPNAAPCPGTTGQYGVCVYAIGSGGSLTAVQGNFNFINGPGFQNPNIVAVAATPTILPQSGINGTVNSVCTVPGGVAPTAEFLYAVDAVNYVLWEFSVDTSTGALGNPPNATQVKYFATDQVPMGVAVDPCDRFVYASDSKTNKVSAYTLCAVVQLSTTPACPVADGSLNAIPGSPFILSGNANAPGPILVDPFGNNLYVLGTLSNTISPFKIASITGAITALTPAIVATGIQPTSMVIRRDDNWMFVANFGGATVSQYSITPGTGTLSGAAPIPTDNYPFGVAVK